MANKDHKTNKCLDNSFNNVVVANNFNLNGE